MVRKVAKRDEATGLDDAAVAVSLAAFRQVSDQITALTKIKNQFRDELSAAVEEFGEPDDKGHIWLELPDGQRLQRQRRVSTAVDEENGIPWLRDHGFGECITTIEVIDDDAVMKQRYLGNLSDEDIDRLYPKSITYAFVVPKA